MRKATLTLPQLLFIVGTRAALGAGIALLAGNRLKGPARRRAGTALAVVGAATTIPAAKLVFRKYSSSPLRRLTRALW